jgi:hypothetical protein
MKPSTFNALCYLPMYRYCFREGRPTVTQQCGLTAFPPAILQHVGTHMKDDQGRQKTYTHYGGNNALSRLVFLLALTEIT